MPLSHLYLRSRKLCETDSRRGVCESGRACVRSTALWHVNFVTAWRACSQCAIRDERLFTGDSNQSRRAVPLSEAHQAQPH
ncbi:hypothetical protein CDAR_78721 [Caerostris darwini]|uniref:Uncharacterized protein n=1 Tax=Caerostris darwini TaxID=1538125 RepID=A0AAV4UW07_9ARAC|nr:hypothetical protein CDAR_78721 [Caerostris darwini]